jgi:hypothetical protein
MNVERFINRRSKGRSFSAAALITLWVLSGLYVFTTAFNSPIPPAASSASSSGVGIRSYVRQAANQAVTASTTVVSSDLTVPVAVGQKYHIRYFLPFTLGGTAPGIKFQVTAPATPTTYLSACVVFSNAGAVSLESVITSQAAQGVTLATAGNHHALIEFDYSATVAGNIVLQFAQNVSDAAATTLLKGAYAEVVKIS